MTDDSKNESGKVPLVPGEGTPPEPPNAANNGTKTPTVKPEKVDAEPPKQPDDDKDPDKERTDYAQSQAKADARKPLEPANDELFSDDAAKVAARRALEAAYAKAVAKPAAGNAGGALRAKYDAADEKFQRAAKDMQERLAAWIAARIAGSDAEKPSIVPVFQDRAQVAKRLEARLGKRESARDAANAKVKLWEKAYADWTKPVDGMTALIGSYAERIDKLNADINILKNADWAIQQFWFEVARSHLQLRPASVTEADAPGVKALTDALEKALGPDNEFTGYWTSGRDRGDGSLFLLDPDPGALTEMRKHVLSKWKNAADAKGIAEGNFKLRPDDAASLKTRRDALEQGRAAALKAILEDPAP